MLESLGIQQFFAEHLRLVLPQKWGSVQADFLDDLLRRKEAYSSYSSK